MRLTFEVWPNMPWGRLEAAGPAWNSWGDKPLEWCAERFAEYGYDGIDVIFPKLQEIPREDYPRFAEEFPARSARARPRVRLHRRALDLRLPAPLRPRARHRELQGGGRRRRGPRRRLGLHAARRRLLRPAAERPARHARTRGRRPSARSRRWRPTARSAASTSASSCCRAASSTASPCSSARQRRSTARRCGLRSTPARSIRRSSRSWTSAAAIAELGDLIDIVHVKDEIGLPSIVQTNHTWMGGGLVDFGEVHEALDRDRLRRYLQRRVGGLAGRRRRSASASPRAWAWRTSTGWRSRPRSSWRSSASAPSAAGARVTESDRDKERDEGAQGMIGD